MSADERRRSRRGVVGEGRPRVGTPVEVRIPDDVLAAVDVECARLEVTRAAYIRRVVTVHATAGLPDEQGE